MLILPVLHHTTQAMEDSESSEQSAQKSGTLLRRTSTLEAAAAKQF